MAKLKKKAGKVKKKEVSKVKKKKTTIANAAKILSDVHSEKCFWANNGWIIKNLQELPIALENMSDETFAYHVNEGKNDFARWISDVIYDKELAKNMEKLKKREAMITKVKGRIAQLKR